VRIDRLQVERVGDDVLDRPVEVAMPLDAGVDAYSFTFG